MEHVLRSVSNEQEYKTKTSPEKKQPTKLLNTITKNRIKSKMFTVYVNKF